LDEVKREEIAGRRHRDPSLKVRVRHTLRRALSKFMTVCLSVCLSVCVSYSQKEKGVPFELYTTRRDTTRHAVYVLLSIPTTHACTAVQELANKVATRVDSASVGVGEKRLSHQVT